MLRFLGAEVQPCDEFHSLTNGNLPILESNPVTALHY